MIVRLKRGGCTSPHPTGSAPLQGMRALRVWLEHPTDLLCLHIAKSRYIAWILVLFYLVLLANQTFSLFNPLCFEKQKLET